jgi:hypothetical protein
MRERAIQRRGSMTRKLSAWLAVTLAGAGFVAGCGSSDKSISNGKTAAAPTTSSSSAATSTSPPATTGSTGSTGATAPGATTPSARKSATACVKAIEKRTSLSASAKAKLAGICERATSTDVSTRRKAAHEACFAIVNGLHMPAGVARERALAICRAP